MKADRLLSALLVLQAHGRLTARELARRLEVSQRTVHRDMEALSAAGVPVFALRGSHGGWQLEEGWRTRVPGLEEAELRALLMAQPRVIGDPRLARAAERALDKLMAALPASLREQAAAIRQRLHVDPTGWNGVPESLAMLPIVQDAVARDRKLAMRYRTAGQERIDRVVDPLGLVAKGATWYLVAQTPDGFRTYRVSRIEEASALDRPAQRPADFNLAAYWKASTEELKRKPRFQATLRLEPSAVRSVKCWRATTPAAGEADVSGWVTLHVEFEDEEQARFFVLGLAPRVDVLAPSSLCARVASDLAAAVDRLRQRQREPNMTGSDMVRGDDARKQVGPSDRRPIVTEAE